MPEEDDVIEITEEEVLGLTSAELDRITVRNIENVRTNRFPQDDGTQKHVTDFGDGSHWTMVYAKTGEALGCEYHRVRFERLGSNIRVMPSKTK